MKTVLLCICLIMTTSIVFGQWTVVNGDVIYSSDEDLRIVDDGPEIELESNALVGAGIKSKWWASGNLVTLRSYDGDMAISANDDILFYQDQNLKATLNQDGNFGLGISNPLYKLHMDGDMRLENAARIDWFENSVRNAYLYYNTEDLYLVNLKSSGNGTPGDIFLTARGKLTITTNNGTSIVADDENRVGIGTSNPQYDLHVSGDIGITGELTATSDFRLKEDIKEVENATHQLMQLRPVTYTFRHEEFPDMNLSDRRKIGLIAQEVEKIFPELVSTTNQQNGDANEMADLKSVNYMELIPILIKSLQELKTTLNQQDEQLQILRKQLNREER